MKAILVYYADCEIDRVATRKVFKHLSQRHYKIYVYGPEEFIMNKKIKKKDTLKKFVKRNQWTQDLPITYDTYDAINKSDVDIFVDDFDTIETDGEAELNKKGVLVPKYITNNYFQKACREFNL